MSLTWIATESNRPAEVRERTGISYNEFTPFLPERRTTHRWNWLWLAAGVAAIAFLGCDRSPAEGIRSPMPWEREEFESLAVRNLDVLRIEIELLGTRAREARESKQALRALEPLRRSYAQTTAQLEALKSSQGDDWDQRKQLVGDKLWKLKKRVEHIRTRYLRGT